MLKDKFQILVSHQEKGIPLYASACLSSYKKNSRTRINEILNWAFLFSLDFAMRYTL